VHLTRSPDVSLSLSLFDHYSFCRPALGFVSVGFRVCLCKVNVVSLALSFVHYRPTPLAPFHPFSTPMALHVLTLHRHRRRLCRRRCRRRRHCECKCMTQDSLCLSPLSRSSSTGQFLFFIIFILSYLFFCGLAVGFLLSCL